MVEEGSSNGESEPPPVTRIQAASERAGKVKDEREYQYPEELYRHASEVAAEANVSVDELFASTFEERLLEFERLKDKAARGS